MKRFLSIGSMIALLASNVRGQQPVRFDTVQFGPVSYAIGYAVFPDTGGYAVFSLQKFSGTSYQDISVVRFDAGGGELNSVRYATSNPDWIGSSSPVIAVDSGFITGCDRYEAGGLDSLFLQFYHPDGMLGWEHLIRADSAITMRGMALTSENDWLLCGLHQYPEEAYVYRLDSVGNIKSYHGYSGFDGEDVVEAADGKWYVCGRGNQLNNYSQGVVLRSDTTGLQFWRHTDPYDGKYSSLVATKDSGVVVVGSHLQADDLTHAHVIKLNKGGSILWQKNPWVTINDSWPCRFHAGYENTDSTLIVAGWLRDTVNRDAGMLFKLDKEGNTIWKRFYSHYPGAAYGKDQIFWDVKPTSDGGMVLTGETNSDDYPYAQLWLLKLDSMGCLVEGCGNVGVDQYLDAYQPLLRISPNPANDVFNLSLDLPEGSAVTGEVQAMLLDAQGKLVVQQTVQQHLNQLRATFDVRALAAGTYYLHLRDGKRWLAGAKVIVQ